MQAEGVEVDWSKIILTQTNEQAQECVETNYYGPKRMVEALITLLQLSDSPRIVNVSSSAGRLKVSANIKYILMMIIYYLLQMILLE